MRNSKANPSLKWWILVPLLLAAAGIAAILLLGSESPEGSGFIYTIK